MKILPDFNVILVNNGYDLADMHVIQDLCTLFAKYARYSRFMHVIQKIRTLFVLVRKV
mgnify:CR=1 FL=1